MRHSWKSWPARSTTTACRRAAASTGGSTCGATTRSARTTRSPPPAAAPAPAPTPEIPKRKQIVFADDLTSDEEDASPAKGGDLWKESMF